MNADEVIDAHYEPAPLAVVAEPQQTAPALFGTTDPVESIGKMVAVADALKAILTGKNLISNIQGKQYVQVEGWQVLAGMLRISAIIEWTRPVDGGGWECRCVVRDPAGNDIGAGEGQCTRDERTWSKRDDYALRAMAQTRATSRALRNVLGFIVTLAGFQATPADEVPKDGFVASQPAPVAQPAATRVAQPDPKSAVIARAIGAGVIPAGAGIDELRAYCADKGVVATPVAVNAHLDALAAQRPVEAKETRNAGEVSVQQRALAMTLHKKLGHDDDFRAVMYDARFGKSSFKQLSKEEVSALIDELQDAIAKVGGEA